MLGLKKLISAILAFFSLFLLVGFRSVPVSQFWKGYRILYVYSDALGESDILTILEKNGCSSVISYEKQRIPVLSPIAPVQVQDTSSYLYRRNDFFSDKNHRAIVFYVPEGETSALNRAIRELSAFQGTVAGTDGKSSFPWISPIIVLGFFLILLYFSKKRLLFSFGAGFFMVLAFSRPLYTVSASSCLFIFAFFLFHRLWSRQDFLKITLNSPYVILFSVFPPLVLLLSSPVNALFYAVAFLGAVSSVFFYHYMEVEKEKNSLYSFQPVFIRSARMIPLVGRSGFRLLLLLVSFVILVFVAFNLSGNFSSSAASASMPSLPAPVPHSQGELVGLKDFIGWTWNTVTFPYRKIGSKPSENEFPAEGEVVSITDYTEDSGKIVPSSTTAYAFNSEFRENVYKSIEGLDYPALEKLLLRQGKNASFGYARSASSSSSSEKFGSVLLVVLIALPLSFAVYYILKRRRYGLGV